MDEKLTAPAHNAKNKMASLRQLYKIGRGPSSSHTLGPEKACRLFREKNPDADAFRAELYGSLSLTGKGHGTDRVIEKTFSPIPVLIDFRPREIIMPHPNTIRLLAFRNGRQIDVWEVISVGGGKIEIKGMPLEEDTAIYPHNSFAEIAAYCSEKQLRLGDYVEAVEGKEIRVFLSGIWQAMRASIREGLQTTGILPGGLSVQRKANFLFTQTSPDELAETKENRLVCSFAFAVSEENAAGGVVVTAPTCGSCGVLPAVLYYMQQKHHYSDDAIINALAAAGVIGNLIKTNASISGAECGCQAEIGSACSMAAAALADLFGMRLDQLEYAAEVAMEHHLGLTCDPIRGLVQIPCIERNAVAAMRAINAVNLANFLTDTRKISFDLVVKTMYETGKDLSTDYKERGTGGLAKLYE